jgi:GPH family glycoside/pentoside/hexuronide:cation symporter
MSHQPVPVRTKVFYGFGELGLSLKIESLNRFLMFFYTDTLRLSPTAVGVMILVSKAWDAITDPAMGYVSDATRSRWGRRRPYVLLGAAPMGLCYALLFAPPPFSGGGMLAYMLLVSLALYTCFSVYTVPYYAWGAELARDYHERTAVVQVRALLGLFGGVAGAAVPMLIVARYADPRAGFAAMAAALGTVIAVAATLPGAALRDRGEERVGTASVAHFLDGLRHTFANRDFRLIFATFCLMTIAMAMGTAIQLVVVKYRLRMYEQFPLFALTFGISLALSFPLWLGLSRRLGKSGAMQLGLVLGCIAPFGWVLVQPGQVGAMVLFMVAAGAVTGSLTLAASQAIDVVDLDELHTGERRAGAYFGIWAFGLKLATAIGQFLGGALLDVVGYVPDAPQDPDTLWWLVMLVGPLQSVVTLIGLLVFRHVRFDAAELARVQAALEDRRSGG